MPPLVSADGGFLFVKTLIPIKTFRIIAPSKSNDTMNGLNEIERRIYVSEEIAKHEYQYVYGNKSNSQVHFSYYNVKKDKEGKTIVFENYTKALAFARYREGDKRYKNYEFFIET